MKKFLKIIGVLVGIIALIIIGFVSFIAIRGIPSYEVKVPAIAQVEVTPERIARGEKLASMLCNSCHMDQGTGKFTGREMLEAPQFGKLRSKNITQDKTVGIGAWTDAELIYFIRTGIHPHSGKYIPPYMPKLAHISDEDLSSLIAFLHSDDQRVQPSTSELPDTEPSFLTKFLCFVAFKPFPFPEKPIMNPDTNNMVEWGHYIATAQLECFSCHSNNFETNDFLTPENSKGFFGGGNKIRNPEGVELLSLNLTMDEETGIGSWSEEQFVTALRTGVVPHGPALRNPMTPYPQLTEQEAKAIFAYLKTIPKIKNKVERPGV